MPPKPKKTKKPVTKVQRYDPAIQPSCFGRPTLYKPEYCEQLLSYFEREAADRTPINLVVATSDKGQSFKPIARPFPTLEKWAHDIGVTTMTMRDWEGKHPDFLAAVARAKEIQKQVICADGWTGLVPPATFAFVASNFTDMRQKTEQVAAPSTTNTTTINVLGQLSDSVLMEIQKALEGKSKEPLVIEGKAEES